MLNKISRVSTKHKIMVGLTSALIVWGVWSDGKLPVDAFPDSTNNQVLVIIDEQSFANRTDLVEMRSISQFGLSVIRPQVVWSRGRSWSKQLWRTLKQFEVGVNLNRLRCKKYNGASTLPLWRWKLVLVLQLRSSIAGILRSVNVKVGTNVDLSTMVAEIVDNSQLYVDLDIYEKDLLKLKCNQASTVQWQIIMERGMMPKSIYLAHIWRREQSRQGICRVNGGRTGLIDRMSTASLFRVDKFTAPAVQMTRLLPVRDRIICVHCNGHVQ